MFFCAAAVARWNAAQRAVVPPMVMMMMMMLTELFAKRYAQDARSNISQLENSYAPAAAAAAAVLLCHMCHTSETSDARDAMCRSFWTFAHSNPKPVDFTARCLDRLEVTDFEFALI